MESNELNPETYFPKGALAFFFIVIAAYAATWTLFYVILVKRG